MRLLTVGPVGGPSAFYPNAFLARAPDAQKWLAPPGPHC